MQKKIHRGGGKWTRWPPQQLRRAPPTARYSRIGPVWVVWANIHPCLNPWKTFFKVSSRYLNKQSCRQTFVGHISENTHLSPSSPICFRIAAGRSTIFHSSPDRLSSKAKKLDQGCSRPMGLRGLGVRNSKSSWKTRKDTVKIIFEGEYPDFVYSQN